MLVIILLFSGWGARDAGTQVILKNHMKILIKNKESQICPYFTPFEIIKLLFLQKYFVNNPIPNHRVKRRLSISIFLMENLY